VVFGGVGAEATLLPRSDRPAVLGKLEALLVHALLLLLLIPL
jgi:hypothetical protein